MVNTLVTDLSDKEYDDNEQETSATKTEEFVLKTNVLAFASRPKAKARPRRPTSACSSTRTVNLFAKEYGPRLNQELNRIVLQKTVDVVMVVCITHLHPLPCTALHPSPTPPEHTSESYTTSGSCHIRRAPLRERRVSGLMTKYPSSTHCVLR